MEWDYWIFSRNGRQTQASISSIQGEAHNSVLELSFEQYCLLASAQFWLTKTFNCVLLRTFCLKDPRATSLS
jgi:hypothetical protein